MINIKKLPRFAFFYHCLLNCRQNCIITARPFTNCYKITLRDNLIKLNIRNHEFLKTLISRGKTTSWKKTYKKRDEDEDEDDDDNKDDDDDPEENDYNFKGDEVKTYETEVARIDKILKLSFRYSRKNIEDMFYQTKIRLNGKILKKKSANVNIGDEIDIIKSFVNDNSKLINVNRIKILNIKQDFDSLRYFVKVKKSKSLIIQNYCGSDEWTG